MTSSHAGKSAPTLYGYTMMTSTTGYSRTLHLFLLGILLPPLLVSGQSTTTMPLASSTGASASMSTVSSGATTQSATMNTNTASGATTQTAAMNTNTATTASGAATQSAMMNTNTATTTPEAQAASTNQPSTSGGTMMTPTAQSSSSTTVPTSSGGSAATTQPGSNTPSAASASPITSNSISATNSGTNSGPSTASAMTMTMTMTQASPASNSMMSTNQPSVSTGMSGMNGTNSSSMAMISCPSFACNYSDCYSMYMSQNTTKCNPGDCCELIKQADMYYTVGCSSSCSESCVNASQTNCSVECCKPSGCLSGSFASMMMTTTAMATTKRATTTPMATTTAKPQTTAKTGNQCHQGKCTGTDCYKAFKTPQTCTSSQPHCQLKKETVGSALQWTASCTTNCSAETPCKATTKPPCHLECCNATLTSCLLLNGTLNVPNVATRGPHLNTELIASFLCMLALTLLR